MKKTISLSVLVLSISERLDKLNKLIRNVSNQINLVESTFGAEVELIVDLDNCKRSIVEKRNSILHKAQGTFICFIDDDDEISPDFVMSIVEIIESGSQVDCITFNQECNINGKQLRVSFGLGNPVTSLEVTNGLKIPIVHRPPYHMCAFRSQLAKSVIFRESTNDAGKSTEDIDWLVRLYPLLETEHKIQKVLHLYKFNSGDSRS